MRSLAASLGDHPMAMLRGIADLRSIDLDTNVRDDAAERLMVALRQPGATEAALARASVEAQSAWAALVAASGRMKIALFARKYGPIRPAGPGRIEREALWRQPAGAAEELWYAGLIFRAFRDLGEGLLEYVYIPEDMLPATARMSVTPLPKVVSVLPADVLQHDHLAAVDMCVLLATLADLPVGSELHPDDEQRLGSQLLFPGATRLSWLLSLAQTQGWLHPQEDRLVVSADAVSRWLRMRTWEQWMALLATWERTTDWNDLRRLPELRPEGTWQNDPRLPRQALRKLFGALDPDAWYRISDIVAWVKATSPDFQRPDGNYSGWYLRDTATDRYLTGYESWDDVEGRLIRFLVSGPLLWLGLVALADLPDEAGGAFRLTTAGAYWAGKGNAPAFIAPAPLVVHEDFTVWAPHPAPLADRYRLVRATEPIDVSYRKDRPTVHRITRRSLSRARARGVSGEQIRQFLRRATGEKLPAKVEAALARWDQHGGNVRIVKGAVLRVDDASMLATLRADSVLAPLLGDLLSPQAVLVHEVDLAKVLATLEQLGYTTQVDEPRRRGDAQ